MKKNNGIIQIGDYISFVYQDDEVLYKVLDIKEENDETYIKYYDAGKEDYFIEPIRFVDTVFTVTKKETVGSWAELIK